MSSNAQEATDNGSKLDYFDPEIVQKFEKAVATHQAGDLDNAEIAYREILRLTVDHPGALNLIGTLHHQKGDHETAIEFLNKAIEIAPDNPDFYGNQGAAYCGIENFEEAEKCFEKVLSYQPESPIANANMASALMHQGRNDDAYPYARKAFDGAPDNFKFAKRLAEICQRTERFDEAAEGFELCVRMEPDNAEAVNNLGYVYERLENLELAEDHYRRAIDLRPNSPEILNNLAGILARLNRQEEAESYYNMALESPEDDWLDPVKMAITYLNAGDHRRALSIFEAIKDANIDNPEMWSGYGAALSTAGALEEADRAIRKALKLDPNSAELWNSLGINSSKRQDLHSAVDEYKKAIDLSPTYLDPYINICLTFMFMNRMDEAYLYAHMTLNLPKQNDGTFANPVKIFRGMCDFEALDQVGDIFDLAENYKNTDVISSFLAMLPEAAAPEQIKRLAELHFYWGEHLALPKGKYNPLPPRPARAPGSSKLKIGFLSSDLKSHSVVNFVLPVLRHYDSSQVEIRCYSPVEAAGDEKQELVKGLVDDFQILENTNPRDAALQIQNDGIDVLFDLNGFTRDTMIRSLCYKPAPVQIYWLGYPFTTGMPEIDHILVDNYFAPENTDWLAEDPLYMPEAWVCFDSFKDEDIIDTLPVERNGKLTFGTLNNTYKFTRETVAVWATIMNQFEDSEFLLVRPGADSRILQHNLCREFERCGVAPERMKFINNHRALDSHFSYYNMIDISLDTFPQTGGTTTCDAIWMGVPVISLVGPSMHQRVSYSLLENAGCGELACFSLEEYMGKAVMLGNDITSLREYRQNMRPALLESPLCQGERFAQNFQKVVFDAFEKSGA